MTGKAIVKQTAVHRLNPDLHHRITTGTNVTRNYDQLIAIFTRNKSAPLTIPLKLALEK